MAIIRDPRRRGASYAPLDSRAEQRRVARMTNLIAKIRGWLRMGNTKPDSK
jgi:hypothetical protein